ncbi:methyltransferase [Kribbella sp. NPDC056861]|uniref:class I SAM-dependent methyltransferase n=1 Tax=Kribbella sp. NPDC056861 TaxID=3154857 RepID=UPI00341E6098
MPQYPFDNAADAAVVRMRALESTYDRNTVSLLDALGVRPGVRCLEVGAGGGSIARWLADATGPTGSVLATDLDTRFLESSGPAWLEVRRHDIVTDELPAESFDLIHVRLVLVHLPERDLAIRRLVQALAPGGVLIVEDIAALGQQVSADARSEEVYWAVQHRVLAVLEAGGCNLEWPSRLPKLFERAGLTGVGHRRVIPAWWNGGGNGIKLLAANITELRPKLRRAGCSQDELAAYLNLLQSTRFVVSAYPMVSAWGYKE